MNVGCAFDLRNPDGWQRPWADHYARTLEFCEEADGRGADGLWFTEHHLFEDGYLPQPLTFAAAAAARTRTARIGTAVVLPAFRKPAHLAEEAAIVDLISGGRLELGVGAGYRVPEYDLFDTDIGRRFAITEQAVRTVRELWAEGGVTPRPIQDPVPVWGGFYGPRGARLAGRLGIGLLHISHQMFSHYQAGLLDGGHDPAQARVSGLLPIILADDPEVAWSRIAPHAVYQANSYRRASVQGTDQPGPPLVTVDQLRYRSLDRPWGMLEILTPQEAAARICENTQGLPLEHLIFWASIAGMPDDLVTRNIELISEHLKPLLSSSKVAETNSSI
ncbi:MAG: LLM class flavin-dependent oxidoreductase [Pseudonocardiales bacterium]|nr:MAG: LLM class flavin-dependent oxidoreductase [Pseudonocardiales bacterium]